MASKNPTNRDILAELSGMNTRITTLETWKIAEDAARKAVSDYKRDEAKDQEQKSLIEVLKQLAPFIVALTALAYAAIQVLK